MKRRYGLGFILVGILSGIAIADPAAVTATAAEFYVNPGIALTSWRIQL